MRYMDLYHFFGLPSSWKLVCPKSWYQIGSKFVMLTCMLKHQQLCRRNGLANQHQPALFIWWDAVAVSPSISTPAVLTRHAVSPHYVSSDIQNNAGNFLGVILLEGSNVSVCVCVSIHKQGCVRMSVGQWQHWAYTPHLSGKHSLSCLT